MSTAFRWQHCDRPLYVSTSAGTLTLSFADDLNLSFDGEGRLVGAFVEGVTHRRTLDNRVLAKWSDPTQPQRRQQTALPDEERKALLTRCYELVADASQHLATGRLSPVNKGTASAIPAVQAWLDVVTGWDWDRLEAQRTCFHTVYKPVPILPPDQYLSLVVQATEGCSYNECTFCTFYRDRRFRIKRSQEVNVHIDAVQRFLGRGITMRRSLFLADANAVIVAQPRLVSMLQEINQRFPIRPADLAPEAQAAWQQDHPWDLEGIYAFLSAPDALHKHSTDFAELRAQNLRRIYVGVETGHDSLRRFLRKPGTAADVVRAVETIKAGGVAVGLIIMVGVGGERYRNNHFADTAHLLQQMPLGCGDIIYTSPFVADPTSPYVQDLHKEQIAPLSSDVTDTEEQRFRQVLLPWARQRGVRLSHYDLREFIY